MTAAVIAVLLNVALVAVCCRPLRRELARQNARLHVPGDA